jgi:hypothetical protein
MRKTSSVYALILAGSTCCVFAAPQDLSELYCAGAGFRPAHSGDVALAHPATGMAVFRATLERLRFDADEPRSSTRRSAFLIARAQLAKALLQARGMQDEAYAVVFSGAVSGWASCSGRETFFYVADPSRIEIYQDDEMGGNDPGAGFDVDTAFRDFFKPRDITDTGSEENSPR